MLRGILSTSVDETSMSVRDLGVRSAIESTRQPPTNKTFESKSIRIGA